MSSSRASHRNRLCSRFLSGLLLFSLCCYLPLQGQQNTATILGTIEDPSGASIADARVTATEESTGLSRSASSAPDGSFTIPLLPIGRYRVSVEASGFKTFVQTGIVL